MILTSDATCAAVKESDDEIRVKAVDFVNAGKQGCLSLQAFK